MMCLLHLFFGFGFAVSLHGKSCLLDRVWTAKTALRVLRSSYCGHGSCGKKDPSWHVEERDFASRRRDAANIPVESSFSYFLDWKLDFQSNDQ